ncbi:unnamed protein product [Ranitomeya imitator]|uniref:DNA topoisomerase I n=1 Tax=Ranitomeya imitator TaxID=111125 RepID=A0ABN9M3W3_9NEOB|nr:unnamed protein product [Ranitomeya imitator]
MGSGSVPCSLFFGLLWGISVRKCLAAAGLPATQYSGHSFRIGAATEAARWGLGPDPMLVWIMGHSYVVWAALRAAVRPDGRQLGLSRETVTLRWIDCVSTREIDMLQSDMLDMPHVYLCRDSRIPVPPSGHRWKEVRHDHSVTWLASWTENVQGSVKYVMLNANSKLKGEKDWEKYEVARKLKNHVDSIRRTYREDFKSKEMRIRQRAVALYFIDKLALRAGNEKEEGETADTVGCCSLRVEHIKLYSELDGEKHVVEFDFLGKDSIRYYNKVPVEKKVYKNLQLFMDNKQDGDDLFDRLNTPMLNKHLQSLMEGLTAKVFRTYNASVTLQQQLQELTDPEDTVPGRILSYNRANRAVAILCNHQRAPPKTFDQSMANLRSKIEAKKEQILLAKKELKDAKKEAKENDTEKLRKVVESKKKAVMRGEEQLMKLEVQATDREENKQIALSTSKLNYLDPRISVAWCKKWDVGLEKIYNKTHRDKFAWAVHMTDADFVF